MLLLLLGFIAPAILFAFLGLIACIRRGSYSQIDDTKISQNLSTIVTSESFQRARVDTSRSVSNPEEPPNPRPPPPLDRHDSLESYSYGYQNHYFETFTLPPSYSETIALDKMNCSSSTPNSKDAGEAPSSSSAHPSKHLPSRQPRILVTAASPNLRDIYY